MRAIVITEFGGPEVLAWQEVDDPIPAEGEVVIEVAAAGVNRADLQQRQGFYPPPKGASEYPGLECSGRIAVLGEGVEGFGVGDEVCALVSGGAYAEKVAVDAGLVLPVPRGVSLSDAACFPEAAATVWSTVFGISRLAEGEMLLVHGGAGGIGTFAIQLATAMGAGVVTTARGDHGAALRELGAELVIDYRDQDFAEVIAQRTESQGVDVILDNMGASYLDKNLATLNHNGRLMIIGMQGGRTTELDLGKLLVRRVSVSAAGLRARPLAERTAIIAQVREKVWPLIEGGYIRPVVARRIPLAQAADAHRMLGEGGHLGKVVLEA
ncbi:MAG TPA: NAD(P)H-quinone oxidoreductase [Stackebrandtia sp.]|jgi:putative PIG3 family NAD(P)H quinone oxidoreductase|uniref:NAD(P)H-quinone oxidoreductase n=1 Tax=Stackebrandtia sp. TaxID=2023065 RepID=UPI002D5D42ED|nr:NAD(P)H-quinone oxidoreductase [Stackebrandtia sp.]HZE39775.1 NAD(P)H-quinone oxidoreductase [Stackebrandtia sp.]